MARFRRPEKGSVFSSLWQNYTTYLDYEKLPVLRHSQHAFEDLEILGLGLPTVGLGKGQNKFSGGGAPKKGSVFSVFHSWDLSKSQPVLKQSGLN